MRRRIVVVGATGRTGRLVAEELAGRPHVLLIARRADALATLGRTTDLPVRCADLDGLGGVLVPGDIVLSCVGPHDVVGDRVVDAAVHVGATYMDVTGEPAFLARLHADHGPRAASSGASLLPAVGYEYLPGLLLSELALDAAGPAARRVEVAYLVDGGLDAGSATARRSLVRALTRPTTTFRRGAHHAETVAARRGEFRAGGQLHTTVSLGGLEVWALPTRHPDLDRVDVHTGWFGAAAPLLQLGTLLSSPARMLGVDRLMDGAVAILGDGDDEGLSTGTSRFVVRVRDEGGGVLAREEAVAGNAIVLAARLAAATADALAERPLGDVPTGATDPVAALGLQAVGRLAEWAGLVRL